jgi:hypothetical protein
MADIKGHIMGTMTTAISDTSINAFLQHFLTTPMQSPHGSESDASSGELEIPSGPIIHPPTAGFIFTPEDTNILNKYLDEFEQADTPMRNNILEKVMGEIYRLRPGNTGFDKKEAKQASIHRLYSYICILTEAYARKSKSGSIIITPLLIVGQPSSFGDGLQEIFSTMPSVWTSWNWPRKCLEVHLALRNSWVHSSLQPLACGMSCL